MLFVADDDSTLSMVTMLSGTSLRVGGDIPRIVRLVNQLNLTAHHTWQSTFQLVYYGSSSKK